MTRFVGRSAAVDRLMAAVDRAAAGDPSTVLLGADAGVGKTRLLAHVADLAAARGATVVTAGCVDLGEVGVPYLPFAEALTRLSSTTGTVDALVRTRPALLRLVPGGEPTAAATDDEAGRLQLFDGIAAALASSGRAGAPMVLVLEDLHWADPSSRDVLRYLVSRFRTEHVLVVASYRTDDLHRRHPLTGVVAELSRHPRVERLDLPPFSAEELRAFAAAVVGADVTEETLRTVAERSEGNAYFAQELLEAPDGSLPWSLGDVLRARIDRLDPAVVDLARLAAVSGRTVSEALLRAAWAHHPAHHPAHRAGLQPADGSDVDAVLREAVAGHVLVAEDRRMAFRHALLAEVVAADLLPGETSAAHRAYRDALVVDPTLGSAAVLAHHARHAHDAPTALRASLTAADDAARLLAPQEELRHLEVVLELWDAVPEGERPAVDPADLMMRAASAAARAGRDERAVPLARTAVDRAADPARRAVLRVQLARHLLSIEDEREAFETAGRALDELSPDASAPDRAWAHAVRARTALGTDEDDEARRRAEEAVGIARSAGLADVEADALATLAVLRVDDPDEAARLLGAARERAAQAGDLLTQLRCDYNLAATWFYAGHLPAADRELRTGLDHARRAGLTWHGFTVQMQLLQHLVRFTRGDLSPPEPPSAGAPPVAAASLAAVRLYSAVARGDDDVVDAARALEPAGRVDGQVALVAGGCHVDALAWRRRTEEAIARAEAVIEQMSRAWNDFFLGGIWIAALALGALADGAADDRVHGRATDDALRRGDALLARAVTSAQRGRPRGGRLGPEGRAWLARAHAEHARLHGEHAVALWTAATDEFGYGHRYEQARSRYRLAEALLGAGDRDAARTEAGAALDEARAMGARPLVTAVEALGRRGRLELPGARTGGDVLTSREEEVLRLVADGLSNRQIGERLFISGKTVSVHVSNLLAKLGATGRAEAVTVAHRRGLLGVGSDAH
ncbi:helix-turn-helix transcriptional regulator [Cellulomonas carbonis]|uniref:helix-turn-helix transcriptional regulator n=3 Tax=Cellulomonas carbonis TaxID=1386092 RepID=UPI0016659450|nr:helix-turn-helix transcriptional regulator [Cellulomonas carbonis]